MHYVKSRRLLLSKTYNGQRVEIYVYRDSNRAYNYAVSIGFYSYSCRTVFVLKIPANILTRFAKLNSRL